ncbi:unnamed protein product [Clonostachys rosea]|uniref:Ketoreductase (KR) domain-containing protein n=1 Tax=Bionectria ochroleuca TaxID=29856 RepID=A0ABY6UIB5_BIOOC|nr:unnamed protein product [Clonostachys rosea]
MAFYQAAIPPLPESLDLNGQTAVLTGATAGIGLELSLQLLSRGLKHLIVGVRDVQKGGVTRLDLLSNPKIVANNPNAQITVLKLDLSSLESVAKFSNEVLGITSRLDCLILCAGINTAHFEQTGDGNEQCFQVNVISNFLIQMLLLPLVQSTAREYYDASSPQQPPTITWVGSMGQAFHTPDLGRDNGDQAAILQTYASKESYSAIRRYPDTKLFVSMISRELASSIPDGVIVNNVCPGTVKTGADNNLPFYLRIPMNFNRFLRGRSVEDGARAVFWAARGGLHKDQSNGFYVADNRPQEASAFINTPEGQKFAKKLWHELILEGKKWDFKVGEGLAGSLIK